MLSCWFYIILDGVQLVYVAKMVQNFNTFYPVVYAGAFLWVKGANFLENIAYIQNEWFRKIFLPSLRTGKINKQKNELYFSY